MMRVFLGILFLVCWLAQPVWAGLQVGQVPEKVELAGDAGGRLDGSPWSSDELKGKVHVLFYVDPDEKDLNNPASEALKEAEFPLDKYRSLGVINMAATWLPNFVISSSLEKKQEKYPSTLYLRDYKKVFVTEWGIADDTSDVLAFDKLGRLLFIKEGLLNEQDIQDLLRVIREHLDD